MAVSTIPLQEISPDTIKPNPDNPRLIFREEQMNELLESIRQVGIKVPLSVYPDTGKFTIIDGERRWRCARRLNLSRVPVIVQPKPTKLENLLMMFNIHNVRVDWDIMPMALKLRDVRDMLMKEGKLAKSTNLAAITGVPLATVRRAFELLDLPSKYQDMLLEEAKKPRKEQRIKADLFIETYKSLHVVERYTPEVLEEVTKDQYVDSMVNKYVTGVIDNVVKFRDIAKIARAELASVSKDEAVPVIIRLVEDPSYTIDQAYNDTVEAAYEQRDLVTKLRGITDRLTIHKNKRRLTNEVRIALTQLRAEIIRLLGE